MSSSAPIRRVAMLSVHTSPLEQPGTGDAGGMNVYVAETARHLAERGVEVDVFTRATTGALPRAVGLDGETAPGSDPAPAPVRVTVHHVMAGPYEGLSKDDLPGQLCAFTAGVMHAAARRPEGWYDLIHSHYWLSGQVGWLMADRWDVPLVHTMHTMARVKNQHLAQGDRPEPPGREIGEQQVVDVADRLVANTPDEARQLVEHYAADPAKIRVVPPGVDLHTFSPAADADQRARERAELGIAPDALLVLFVGRIQPLKAPDVLVRALADLVRRRPDWSDRLTLAVLGGPSGSGTAQPKSLERLGATLGVSDRLDLRPPADRESLARWFRCADIVAVPSRSESFGLVALEAQACGATVLAAEVGGLPTAVGDAGVLVAGHDPQRWSAALEGLLADPARRAQLGGLAVRHAAGFGWVGTTDTLLEVYADARAQHARSARGRPGQRTADRLGA